MTVLMACDSKPIPKYYQKNNSCDKHCIVIHLEVLPYLLKSNNDFTNEVMYLRGIKAQFSTYDLDTMTCSLCALKILP